MANVDIQLNRGYVSAGSYVTATGGPVSGAYLVAADGTISVDTTNQAAVESELASLLASPPGGVSPLSGDFLIVGKTIDCSVTTAQSLLTSPEGRKTVITKVTMRNPSGDPSGATFAFGWDSPPANVVSPGASLDGADTNTGAFGVIQDQFGVGSAGDVFACLVATANPSVTVKCDIAGYYI